MIKSLFNLKKVDLGKKSPSIGIDYRLLRKKLNPKIDFYPAAGQLLLRFSSLAVLLLWTGICFAQDEVKKKPPVDTLTLRSMATSEYSPELPTVIRPSPESSALTRYGDYPVDYRTGLIETKIPLYEVQSGSLKLPINLQYHASGRMANEINGIFGMRWTLESGGVITRTMKGRPDEWENVVPFNLDPYSTPSYDVLQRSVTDGYIASSNSQYIKYDNEFDVFRFVLPSGKQGKFILKKENGTFRAMTVPYLPLKIEVIRDLAYYGYFSAIQLTDTDGTVYVFGNKTHVDAAYIETTENPHDNMSGSIPSAWYLKEIISANRKDMISLQYTQVPTNTLDYREVIVTGDRIRDDSDVLNPHPNDLFAPALTYMLDVEYKEEHISGDYEHTRPLTVSRIYFDQGTVEFYYQNKPGLSKNSMFLDHISIPAINRTINFTTEKNANETELYYLKSVQFMSGAGLEQRYAFDYFNPPNPLGAWAGLPSKDWWGYLKLSGADSKINPLRNPWLVRAENASTFITVGYNVQRTPYVESKKIGMLKSIAYPTGGRTVFDYEDNLYNGTYSSTDTEVGPGLRIKEVRNQPLVGEEIVRRFKYGANEDGRGHLIEALRANTNNQSEYSMMIYYDYNGGVLNPDNPLTYPAYGQVGYRVREYSADFEFNYNDFGDSFTSYEYVTEYIGAETNQLRKDVYQYSMKNLTTKEFNPVDYEFQGESVYKKIFVDPEHSWEGGKLLNKTSYVDGGLGVLSRKSFQETYSYEPLFKEDAWDMPAYRHVLFVVDRSATPSEAANIKNVIYDKEKYYHENFCNVFGYGFRKYVSGNELLAQKQTTEFNSDGSTLLTQTSIAYENQFFLPRTETSTNSKGEVSTVNYQYIFDSGYSSLAPYSEMLTNNIISVPVKQELYVHGNQVKSRSTSYKKWADYLFLPEKEYFKTGTGPESLRISFLDYDSYGGVASVAKESGPEVCYLYSYAGSLPIAKIEGAAYSQLKGLLGGKPAIDAFSSLLNPSDSQIAAFLAPLRNPINLPQAHVTSFTYRPLVGLTSMTDPKGMITSYEYDSFQRLKAVRDLEGHIIKQYDYHYRQP